MATKSEVLQLHADHPEWGATVIADALSCSDAYVRATARRAGLQLPRSPYGAVPSYGASYMAKKRERV